MKKLIGKRITALVLCMLMLAMTVPCFAADAAAEYISYSDNFESYSDENPFKLETWSYDAAHPGSAYWYISGGSLSDNDSMEVIGEAGNKVLKLTNNLKAADGETADAANLPQVYFRMPKAINGIVDVSYKLKIETENKYLDWGNNFFAALCDVGGEIGASVGVHTPGLYIPDFGSGSVAFDNTYADGAWHVFNITLDYNAKKYTVSFDGAKSNEYDLTKDDLRTLSFQFKQAQQMSVYIDDVTVNQTSFAAPKLISSSIKNGAKGISQASGTFTFDFNDAMSEESLSGIKLYKGTEKGTLVATTASVSGTKVTVNHPTLATGSLYTLVIPNTVKSAYGVAFSGETITFTTKAASLDVNIDFEDININADGLTEAQRIGALNEAISAKYGITSAYTVNFKQLRWNNDGTSGYDGSNSIWDGIFDGKKNITVEDGKLKLFRSKDCTDNLYYMVNIDPNGADSYKITDGIVDLSFKFNYLTKTASSQLFQFGQDSFKIYLAHGSSSSVYQVGSWGNGGDVTAWKDFTNVETTFNLRFDLTGEKGKVTTTVDGYETLSKTVELTNKEFDRVLFYIDKNTENDVTFTLDDISIKHIPQPTFVSSVANGAENVSAVDGIDVTFNAIMSGIEGITLKDSDGNAANFSGALDKTGYKYLLKFKEPLKANEKYTLSIPELTSADGLKSTAQTIEFKTEAKVPDLYVSNYEITGAESIEAKEAISVSAEFRNRGENVLNAWLGIALYSADNKLLKVAYAEKDIAGGNNPQTVEAELITPDEVADGAFIKIFAWNGADLMKPVKTVITD